MPIYFPNPHSVIRSLRRPHKQHMRISAYSHIRINRIQYAVFQCGRALINAHKQKGICTYEKKLHCQLQFKSLLTGLTSFGLGWTSKYSVAVTKARL